MYHQSFVNEGYEGIMLRRYACVELECCDYKADDLCKKCQKRYRLCQYRSKRTNALMKYKSFQDEEAQIVGFEVGVGTEQGAIIYRVLDKRGNEFTVRPRGTVAQRKELYQKREELLGLPLTIRFQELSKDGVPRFPVGIAIRNYE
jgi:ATP-dependent DNA ligase